MPTVYLDFPISVFSVLHKEPESFAKELRLAAAVKWYELGKLSQEKAAEIAGLSREGFINSLKNYNVDFMQYSEKDIVKELKNEV